MNGSITAQFLPVGTELVGAEQVWLALGTVVMLLGTLYFAYRGYGAEDEEARLFYAVTTLIPAIAFASYLAMFLGYGVTSVTFLGEEHPIYWARYADWFFTTPLLLFDLALLVDADDGTTLGLIGADVVMIATGLVGALTEVYAFRFVWWAVSTAALLYIIYVLYFGFTKRLAEMPEERASTFTVLRNLTIVLWAAYPVVWLVGTEGAGVVSLFVETLLFMVLDVSAKVGFGLVLLSSRAAVGDLGTGAADVPEPSAGDHAADAATETEPAPSDGTVELSEDDAGEWRWRLRADNGNVIADSGEGYASRNGAENAIDRIRSYVTSADYLRPDPTAFDIYRDAADEWRWRLVHRNGNVLADGSEGYANRSGARRAVDRLTDRVDEMTAEVYEDDAGEYRWRLLGGNGQIVADSGEGYTDRDAAADALDRVREYVPDADTLDIGQPAFEVYEDSAGKYRWRLRHQNGRIMADSGQGYASRSGVRDAIESVRRVAPDADTEHV